MGIKNAEFDAEFESDEKISCENNFIIVWKSFRPFTFFDDFLALFLTTSNFSCYDTHKEKRIIFFLIVAIFANFKAKIGRMAQKRKTYL